MSPPPSREKELLALAIKVERDHGELAPAFIAARIGEMASLGEQDGIKLWQGVARAYQSLSMQSGLVH